MLLAANPKRRTGYELMACAQTYLCTGFAMRRQSFGSPDDRYTIQRKDGPPVQTTARKSPA